MQKSVRACKAGCIIRIPQGGSFCATPSGQRLHLTDERLQPLAFS